MSRWLARLIVHLFAWLAPKDQRARWREEWIAEIQNNHRSHLARSLGAPVDSLLLRLRSWSLRSLRAGSRADLVQTARILHREPWHVVAVALCLGAGTTAAVTTFSIINGLVYGEIPGIVDRSTLSVLYLPETGRLAHFRSISLDDYSRISAAAPAGISVTASSNIDSRTNRVNLALRLGNDSIPIIGQFVAGNFFEVLGTRPARGRLITPTDDGPDAYVGVIGYNFWRRHLNASPEVIGSVLTISGQAVRVVGIAPERFTGGLPRDGGEGAPPELWLPLSLATRWPGEPTRHVVVLVRQLSGELARGRRGLAPTNSCAAPTSDRH